MRWLTLLLDRTQVEPSVLRRLFLGKQKFLKSVEEETDLVQNLKEQMKYCLKAVATLSRSRCRVGF